MDTRRGVQHGVLAVGVFAAVVLAQLPLALNPGYFSHDELQWAAFAAEAPGQHFRPHLWSDLQAFQYRPLTFSLWLWLSSHLFAHPMLFHTVVLSMGALNAALLALLLARFGVSRVGSVVAALVFGLGPYAAYAHGWVGTKADLIWVGCALVIGLIVQGETRPIRAALAAFSLTLLALLAKEAAIVIPALLSLAWVFLGRRPAWGVATLASLVPVMLYLAIRIGVLLFTPRAAGSYAWSLASIPLRWAEYHLFAPLPGILEIHGTLARGPDQPQLLLAVLLWLVLARALWRAGPRWLLAFVLVGGAALGPVLVLAHSHNHYGYGFAAAVGAVCAAAWPRLGGGGRAVVAVLALACVWHGMAVVAYVHRVGTIQARFSPAMAQAVVAAPPGAAVRLRVSPAAERGVFLRLTHEIPSYRGVKIGDRVRVVDGADPADYAIEPDGRLTPLR